MRKKILACILMMTMALAPSIAYAQTETNSIIQSKVSVKSVNQTIQTTGNVYVRSGPGKNYKSLGVLKKGTKLTRTGIADNGWCRINYKGKTAYVSGKYIKVVSSSGSKTSSGTSNTLYSTTSLNVRKGPGTSYAKLCVLKKGQAVTKLGTAKNGWYKIKVNGKTGYASNKYLSTKKPSTSKSNGKIQSSSYPMTYSDAISSIKITKEWHGSKSKGAYCYVAHLKFSDYSRFGTACANGKYKNGTETTSHAASRLNAIFCVNGDYSAPYLNYGVVRSGKLCNNRDCWVPGIYSRKTGIFTSPEAAGVAGQSLKSLVSSGKVSDTMCFGPAFLTDGKVAKSSDTSRAQRTFIGTNGKPGDIWIVMSEGRYVDGKSAGLTYTECANLLKSKGCTFGIPLDGGGSSTMIFNGKILNHGSQRAVVDFLYFK